MKIVIFGYRLHPYTIKIVREFNKRSIPITALIERTKIVYPPELILESLKNEGFSRCDMSRFLNFENLKLSARNPTFAMMLAVRYVTKRRGKQDTLPQYSLKSDLADVDMSSLRIEKVRDLNSKETEKLLGKLSPDLIILGGGVQIVRPNILKIPRVGVLNAHMGLLPEYRGMDVMEWMILNGSRLGITVHFVDAGVDTGDIVARKYLKIRRWRSLEEAISDATDLMAESLAEIVYRIENGNYRREKQIIEDGRQYFRMHETLKDLARQRLACYWQQDKPGEHR